jgi:hypothetical protein
MKSEFNDIIEDSQESGEVQVEIPLDKKLNQVKISIRDNADGGPWRSKTYNVHNN